MENTKVEAKKYWILFTWQKTLKNLSDNSWLLDGRQESVTEHTWRLSLTFLLVDPHLAIAVNAKKTLEMIVIRDIIEALVGDVPAFEQFNTETKMLKIKMEPEAINEIRRTLDNDTGEKFY